MGKSPAADYTSTPEDLTGVRDLSNSAKKACCECVYRKDGEHTKSGKIKQLQFDGVTPNGETDTTFKAEIIIDSASAVKAVHVTTRLLARNKTTDTARYPTTVEIAAADFPARIAPLPAAISAAWNARPYRLKITDSKCGERTYEVKFNATFVASDEHFKVDFINVAGMGTVDDYKKVKVGRSYVLPGSYLAKFNLGDTRSASDTGGGSTLEPHEYGHMLGLKDEYKDAGFNRNGCEYEFFDGTKQTVSANGELMGSMTTTSAQPERYCITISYAVISIFAKNGIRVTKMEIV